MTPPKAPPKAPPTAPPPPTSQAPAQASAAPMQFGALAPLTNPRVLLNCVEGWGKTSCLAFAPEPAIICAQEENGYQTLLGAGRVPAIPGVVVSSWDELMATLTTLGEACPYKTIGLDALGGFESMCHRLVTDRDFDGDSGPKGFLNYHKGYDVSVGEWKKMLSMLDRIHRQGVTVMLLSHALDKTISNPLGDDYSSYIGRIHHKLWAVTKSWADAVLFGTFRTIVKPDTKQGPKKGIGGTDRILFCEHRDAFDAKNRYGMPAELSKFTDPSTIWTTIQAAMTRKDA